MNRLSRIMSGLLAACLISVPLMAHAQDVTLGLEGGVAAPLTTPQSNLFTAGGFGAARVHLGILPFLDVAPGVSVLALAGKNGGDVGTAWGVGGGLRLKRPHNNNDEGWSAVSLWVDSNLQYAYTGGLDRFGWDVGLGAALPTSEERNVWVGPFVRYASVFSDTRVGFNTDDSKTLIGGISLELGPSKRKVIERVVQVQRVEHCPDRDRDGVPDSVDNCPDVPGPVSNHGCPLPPPKAAPPVVDMELKQTIQFNLDSSLLDSKAKAALDVVAVKLANRNYHTVVVEGHASSEGPLEHNKVLATQRAQAVVNYLISKGVPKSALTAKGFGSSKPVASNKTKVGREHNRRAEFVVSFIVSKEGK